MRTAVRILALFLALGSLNCLAGGIPAETFIDRQCDKSPEECQEACAPYKDYWEMFQPYRCKEFWQNPNPAPKPTVNNDSDGNATTPVTTL